MTWFRTDDAFMRHPKVRRIPRARRLHITGLWLACGLYAADQLTDGALCADDVEGEGGTLEDAAVLVEVGLWHEYGHDCSHDCPQPPPGGYQFHDWPDYQPTRLEVEEARRKTAERVSKHRKKVRGNGVTSSVTDGVGSEGETDAPSPSPSPSPFSGHLSSSSHQSDAREDDGPTDEQLDGWTPPDVPASVDLAVERRRFREVNAGQWGEIKSRPKAWRAWLRKAEERNRPTPTPGTPECPVHPGNPTGSRQCPACAAEAAPAPSLRALRGGKAVTA